MSPEIIRGPEGPISRSDQPPRFSEGVDGLCTLIITFEVDGAIIVAWDGPPQQEWPSRLSRTFSVCESRAGRGTLTPETWIIIGASSPSLVVKNLPHLYACGHCIQICFKIIEKTSDWKVGFSVFAIAKSIARYRNKHICRHP